MFKDFSRGYAYGYGYATAGSHQIESISGVTTGASVNYHSSYGQTYSYTDAIGSGGVFSQAGNTYYIQPAQRLDFKYKSATTGADKEQNVVKYEYSHFVDYRRGHSGYMINTPTPPATAFAAGVSNTAYPIEGIYDENNAKVGKLIKVRYTSGQELNFTAVIEKPGSYDFLTIPFHDSFYIKLSNWSYWTSDNRPQGYNPAFQASIAVWEDDN